MMRRRVKIILPFIAAMLAATGVFAQTSTFAPGQEVNTDTTVTVPVPSGQPQVITPETLSAQPTLKVILPDENEKAAMPAAEVGNAPVSASPAIVPPVTVPVEPPVLVPPIQQPAAPAATPPAAPAQPAPEATVPAAEPNEVKIAPEPAAKVTIEPVGDDEKIKNKLQEQAKPEENGFVETIKEKFYGPNYDMLPRKQSLMFSDNVLKHTYEALRGITVKSGDVEISVEAATLAPTFYLKSVLYFSPSNWSVWINDTKYNPFYNKSYVKNKAQVEAEVTTVFEDTVIVTWYSQNLDLLSPNWRKDFKYYEPGKDKKAPEIVALAHIDNPGFISPDDNIFVDPAKGEAVAVLRPYQTFVTNSMKVVEGYVAPVIVPLPESAKDTINIKGVNMNSTLPAAVKQTVPAKK